MTFQQILAILQNLGTLGVPSSNTLGALAAIVLKWIGEEAARHNQTEQELLAHLVGTAQMNELELLRDMSQSGSDGGSDGGDDSEDDGGIPPLSTQ